MTFECQVFNSTYPSRFQYVQGNRYVHISEYLKAVDAYKNQFPKRAHHISDRSMLRSWLKLAELSQLLRCESRESIHECGTQRIVGFQADRLELGAYTVHLLGIKALLNNRGHETSELRFLPPLLIRQLHVHKVKSLESVILFNSTVQVDATLLTGVTPDGSFVVHYLQLVLVGCHLHVLNRNDGDDSEERARRFPALRAPARMVVEDVAGEGDFHRMTVTTATKGATGEVLAALCDAVIDQGMKGECHGDLCCVLLYILGLIDG